MTNFTLFSFVVKHLKNSFKIMNWFLQIAVTSNVYYFLRMHALHWVALQTEWPDAFVKKIALNIAQSVYGQN
jgi:hypothetical protein